MEDDMRPVLGSKARHKTRAGNGSDVYSNVCNPMEEPMRCSSLSSNASQFTDFQETRDKRRFRGLTLLVRAAAAVAIFSGVTAPAFALVVANGVGTNFFTFATPEAFVPINIVGSVARTTLPFTLPAAAKVAITFSAECAVDNPAGDTLNSYVDIDIQVDGVAVPPTAGNFDAFCYGHGGPGFDLFTHPSVTVAKSLSAGPHVVTILGRRNGPATGGWLSDSATVIER